MQLTKQLLNEIADVTSKAAIACYPYIGKKDKILADKAATDVMREYLNKLNIDGQVVIGEGELDEAPMLYIGEKLGKGNGQFLDIAVDPLEGTNFAAKFVPSSGSTAISTLGPSPVPNFSPIYNIGASSSSPSPITTFPSIFN